MILFFSISFAFGCLHSAFFNFVFLFHLLSFVYISFAYFISFAFQFHVLVFVYILLFFFSFCLSYQFDRLTRIKILSLFSSNNVFTRKILPNCCSSCPRSSVVPTRKSPSSKPKSSPVMLSSVL